MQQFKVNGQSVPKVEWKQTDGQTDGGDCITSHANAVGKNFDTNYHSGASGWMYIVHACLLYTSDAADE